MGLTKGTIIVRNGHRYVIESSNSRNKTLRVRKIVGNQVQRRIQTIKY